jgi:NADH-dependent peroxiredoxin subunit F
MLTFDLIIIGGGPAGVAAGIYAARKRLHTALITDSFGGQSIVSAAIENWVGVPSISGLDLAKSLEGHLRSQEGLSIVDGDRVTGVARLSGAAPERAAGGRFLVTTAAGKEFATKTVLVASGSRHRRLGVSGEATFEGKGVVFCATCDAPLFKGKDVAVVGGGNSGLEAVIDLIPYASKIHLIHHGAALKGDPLTQEKIARESKVTVVLRGETEEILGGRMVEGIRYRDLGTGERTTLAVDGVFVEIGSVPNSDVVGNLVKRNDFGEILIDHRSQQTSVAGIWAAGDVSDVRYKQNNISVGDAVKAVLNIHDSLKSA